MKDLFNKITDALFPESYTCDLCGIEIFNDGHLCDECKKTVYFNDGATCPICGRSTKVEVPCLECKNFSPAYKKAVSAIIYKDGGVKLILKYKKGGSYLKDYFAELIAPKCNDFTDAEAICYIPMTKKSEYKRGYNQSKLLAEALSERLNLPVLYDALKKVKETQEQKALTKTEREKNLKGCFRADSNLVSGKNLILVDDVMTTGSTAEAAVSALKRRGAKDVYFVSVASVDFKGQINLEY